MADICLSIFYSTQANDLNLLRDAKIPLFCISISLVSALVGSAWYHCSWTVKH